ncbi:hypothetical protein HHK36_001480 [Tetracentron sinense]|uniref:Cupin type-1 domain-containing protein n=1 Tax=Tetracentron sinense TaxID=13715 RepID=A0A835DS25_TETSI|nr:hypothetical protein HHK36_001480 [Tetracentron sinense]
MGAQFLIVTVFLALASSLAFASDPSPLQDFCVAVDDPKDALFVNGKFCKNPMLATAEDFFRKGLDIAGNTSNKVGSNVTQVNVAQIPGLNTLGVSLARVDYAPYGLNPPHTHPRATEILTVLEGTLYVGFVTSNSDTGNRLITKVLNKGDVFVFPIGLIHFQFNTGHSNAVAIAALSSQNPGVITIANSVFGSNPPISDDVLTKAFQVEKNVVDYLQAQFWVFVNGKFCKNPMLLTAEISAEGTVYSRKTSNKVGSNVTQVNVAQIPGLNTLGVSLARVDYAPYGLNPPHTHPRATEILTVLEGTLYVGFGLIHFQFNTGHSNAVAIAALSSQNPGVITIANSVFGSNPPISDDVLTKAFQVEKNVVDYLQAQFWVNN